MAAEGEEDTADAASPAAAEQQREPGSLLTRLLRQLRTVSIRNLTVNNANNNGSPPLPPSTYIQVLAHPPPPPSSSSSPSSTSTTTKPPFRVYYTSEVASFTHNPTWLVLDLEPLDNNNNNNNNNADEGEDNAQDVEGGEEEEEEEGPLPSNLPGEEICIRVFLAPSTNEGDGDDKSFSSDFISTTTKRPGRRRRTTPPHTQPLQRGQHAPLNPSPPLATFLFHLPHLWCLPPTLKLSQLRLPPFPATCLLATGEGGTGLLVEEGVGEGLGLELNGGRREDAPHLLDEQYVEELEEYQHRPSFSASSSSFSPSSSRTLDGTMGKLTLASPSSSPSPSSSSSSTTSQKREQEDPINHRAERARLQALLQRQRRVLAKEEKALAEEEEGLKEEGRVLHALTQRHTSLEREAVEVEEEVMNADEVLLQKEFLVAVRQRKLVGELQRIYPIERRSGEQEYRIRGLELPADVVNTTRDDELVASALGYVCHVIMMLSKYLEVPLRYALECRSSRSLILDATVEYAVFPLYKRGVERERFEWAVYLLKKDIQQLLYARGVPGALLLGKGGVGGSGGGGGGGGGGGMLPEPPYSTHILQNLQALFIHELATSSTLL